MSKANTRVIDLPEKNEPTGGESLYIATETADERITLEGVKNFLGKTFVKKAENLEDIENVEVARRNLDVYNKTEVGNIVDGAKNELNENIQAKVDDVKSTIEPLKSRMNVSEEKNNEISAKIEEIKSKNIERDGEIAKKINTVDAIERFSSVEHTHNHSDIVDWEDGVNDIIRKKIISGTNIKIDDIEGKLKISAVGGGGGSSGGGDMLNSDNLAGLENVEEARRNLGVYSKSEINATVRGMGVKILSNTTAIEDNTEEIQDIKMNIDNMESRIFSGDYNDLVNKPTIPEAVNWDNLQGKPNMDDYVTNNRLNNEQLTVKPLTVTNVSGASASLFLDYRGGSGRKYEFFSDGSGSFGVWDKTSNSNVLRVEPGKTKFFRTPDANNLQIKNVANPTENGDATNKRYVDNQISNHNHDDRYYMKNEVDTAIVGTIRLPLSGAFLNSNMVRGFWTDTNRTSTAIAVPNGGLVSVVGGGAYTGGGVTILHSDTADGTYNNVISNDTGSNSRETQAIATVMVPPGYVKISGSGRGYDISVAYTVQLF